MASKKHRPEEAMAKLRQVDVLVSQGQSVAEAIRAIGVTEVTYYRWRREFGGLKGDQVKRLKELEAENARLRRAVSDLTLDKQILQEAEARELVRHHTPDESGLPFALWSRAVVRALLRQRCGVALAVRTVGKYLARWGFTPQKPLRLLADQPRCCGPPAGR